MKSIEIKSISKGCDKEIIEQAFQILQNNLGENYLSIEDLYDYVNNNQVIVASKEKEIIGILIFQIETEKEFFESYKIDMPYQLVNILNLKTIASKYQKQGIGSALIEFCISNYSDNLTKIYSPLWKSKLGTNAQKLIENFGFELLTEKSYFWYEDSLGKNNYCPVCNNPCVCSALIYCKKQL